MNAQIIEQISDYRHSLSLYTGEAFTLAAFEYQYEFLSLNNHKLYTSIGIGTSILIHKYFLGVNYTYGQKNKLVIGTLIMCQLLILLYFLNRMKMPGLGFPFIRLK